MELHDLHRGLAQLRVEVLQELAMLRQEVRNLRAELAQSTATPSSATLPAVASTTLPELLQSGPAALTKRLQPLLATSPPSEGRTRALWLLEVSENVEDFVRYEGDDWAGSQRFLEDLQQWQQVWGLERVSPQEGDPVDSSVHLVLQSIPGPERRDQVARCARAGYAYGGEILRRAEVVVYL
jgi:hypothetical protein